VSTTTFTVSYVPIWLVELKVKPCDNVDSGDCLTIHSYLDQVIYFVNIGLMSFAISIIFHIVRKIAAEALYALEVNKNGVYYDNESTYS